VFLDPQTLDIVLAYVPVGPLGRGTGQTARTVKRIELPRHVDPNVTAEVKKQADGTFLYSYRISNGAGARQAIRRWHLTIPAPETADPLAGKAPPAKMLQSEGWVGAYHAFRPGEWAVRWEADRAHRIASGLPASAFSFAGKHKPGLVQAFFEGDVGEMPLPRDLPPEALKQLEQVRRMEFSTASLLTIGPMFPPGVPKLSIAEYYHNTLSRLVRGRRLDGSSAFVQEAITRLQEFLERPRSAELDRNEVDPFAPLVNKPRSESTLEAQLYAAMRLALDF
jgi:hypothetical protein